MSDDRELDELLRRAAGELRRPVEWSEAFDARVMASLQGLPAPRRRPAAVEWLLTPRTLRISPLGGALLAAAVLALMVLTPGLPVGSADRSPTGAAPAPRIEVVRFLLHAPAAETVHLVGEFNDWNPGATPLHSVTAGVWAVEVPLSPGRHRYAFLVDGVSWVADPRAPSIADDDFGVPNSVVTVADPA